MVSGGLWGNYKSGQRADGDSDGDGDSGDDDDEEEEEEEEEAEDRDEDKDEDGDENEDAAHRPALLRVEVLLKNSLGEMWLNVVLAPDRVSWFGV